jgi:phosphatidylglycerol lysyltransferase
VREAHAPNGTGELLIDAVMRWAAATDSSWVTLGVAPLAGEVPKKLGWARRGIGFLYDFRGLQRYKAKFQPHGWTLSYLLYPPTQGALRSLLDALRAFTGDGFVRFSLRSWRRGSRAVLRFFAALLLPWTALLALAPARQWFAVPWVKWGWVLFDVMLIVGLFRLLRRPGALLASLLATAVTLDAVLTLFQAVLWNWSNAHGAAAHAVILVACLAPATASVALWGARKRLWRS